MPGNRQDSEHYAPSPSYSSNSEIPIFFNDTLVSSADDNDEMANSEPYASPDRLFFGADSVLQSKPFSVSGDVLAAKRSLLVRLLIELKLECDGINLKGIRCFHIAFRHFLGATTEFVTTFCPNTTIQIILFRRFLRGRRAVYLLASCFSLRENNLMKWYGRAFIQDAFKWRMAGDYLSKINAIHI